MHWRFKQVYINTPRSLDRYRTHKYLWSIQTTFSLEFWQWWRIELVSPGNLTSHVAIRLLDTKFKGTRELCNRLKSMLSLIAEWKILSRNLCHDREIITGYSRRKSLFQRKVQRHQPTAGLQLLGRRDRERDYTSTSPTINHFLASSN